MWGGTGVDNVETSSSYTWSLCGAISERGCLSACLPPFLTASATIELFIQHTRAGRWRVPLVAVHPSCRGPGSP
jgi:hypothetical protein